MKCCLALACVLCSIAICGAACAPEDDATLNGTERNDASVQTRDSGLLADAAGMVSTPDAGATPAPAGSAGLAHDAASGGALDARAEAAVATDAAPRSDADATSAPD